MQKQYFGHACLFGANLIYSINYSVAKEVLCCYIGSSGFILLRAMSAVLLFWMCSLFLKQEQIDKKDRKRFFLCGLFGVALNQLLFFKGLSITSPINSSIMMVCTPILVATMSYFLQKERFSGRLLLGIIMGLGGAVYLILNPSENQKAGAVNLGDLLVLLNACSWGLYLILVQPLMKKYHTITVVKWVFLVGFICVLPFGFQELSEVKWGMLPARIIGDIVFVIVGTTFLAYILNTYSLKILSPSIAGMYIYLQPVLTAAIAVMFGNDRPDMDKIIASLMIFSGVYLASKRPQSAVK
jgi:drug/metabolite transporter (DMT)-like permease